MKKTILAFTGGLLIACAFSFKSLYDLRNNSAEAEMVEGLYVFTDCKPVKEYEYVGTVKGNMSLGSTQYQGVRDRLIKKIKKEHPSAQAVIFHFVDGGTDSADAIRFK